MCSFEDFIGALENVPPELERNFTLMTDLDQRTKDLVDKINTCTKEYKETRSLSRRLQIRQETNDLFEKLNSFAEDKLQLSILTYELIDKNIKKLETLAGAQSATPAPEEDNGPSPYAVDMPIDPNEPKYCICKGVSFGQMIACDNVDCPIEWFHYPCVNLQSAPKGSWYCANCSQYSKPTKTVKRTRRSNRY